MDDYFSDDDTSLSYDHDSDDDTSLPHDHDSSPPSVSNTTTIIMDDYYLDDDSSSPAGGNTLKKIFVILIVFLICPFLFIAIPGLLLVNVLIETQQAKPLPVYRNIKNVVNNDQIRADCSICLDEFNAQNEVVVLRRCKHMYHLSCIQEWATHNKSCPLCRHVVDRLNVFNIITEKSSNTSVDEKFRFRIVNLIKYSIIRRY